METLGGLIKREQIVQKFTDYAKQQAKEPLGKWYAGITIDPIEREKFHKQDKQRCEHFKVLHTCENETEAREIEKALKSKGFSIYKEDLNAAADFSVMESKNHEDEIHYVYTFLGVF